MFGMCHEVCLGGVRQEERCGAMQSAVHPQQRHVSSGAVARFIALEESQQCVLLA
jgi:hypothetical protein